MSSTPSLSDQFAQRLSALPELITFQQIAEVTLRDVDAVRRWQKRPGFPPLVDRKGPQGARRFNRDMFGAFYIKEKLAAAEAGTAPGPKAADALGEIPDTPGLSLTAGEIAALRKVSITAVHKAASSEGFPEPTGVRSAWRTVKTLIEGSQSDAVLEEELLKHDVKRQTLERLAHDGMLERTRESRYRLTPAGRRNSPRLGTQQYLAWECLKQCYPRSLPIDDIMKVGISRTNFAAMVARGDAVLDARTTYRLTAAGRENDPVEEGYGEGEYEYDAAQVASFYRGEHQRSRRVGPLTVSHLEQWAQQVGDTCVRAEIAQAAGRSEDWVAKRLRRKGAPAHLGRRQLKVGRTAYEYDTRTIVDWLKKQFSIED
ncbi:hypothetical protein ACWKT5_19625 [Streptomyces avermitilis]